MEDYNDLLKEYALNNENYQNWRSEHTKMFGKLFSAAFEENKEAQIHFTAALINISQRNFKNAMPKLQVLESICETENDFNAIYYFTGLNHEMMENESKMNEYYEKLATSKAPLIFPIALHPYYRTAKFAQRDSECTKAVFYYRKALTFYDGTVPDAKTKAVISHIIYDIATIYLYMHEYDECKRFLDLSEKYDSSDNQHITYVNSILCAVLGKTKECKLLLKKMNAFLRRNCEPMTEAIFSKNDPHYCIVPQDRTGYNDFWNYLISQKDSLEHMINSEKTLDAQKIISEKLSDTLSFMKRQLACKIEVSNNRITVLCKNYRVKTLVEEYNALFSHKPQNFNDWNFISVNEFENY